MKTAFIGLGVMGFPMAGHLKDAGHEVAVYNRGPEKARKWAERHGGQAFETIAEAVAGAEIVLLCVGKDEDVRDVVAQQPVATTPEVAADLWGYIVERLRAYLLEGGTGAGLTTEMFDAVRASDPASPLDFASRLNALAA